MPLLACKLIIYRVTHDEGMSRTSWLMEKSQSMSKVISETIHLDNLYRMSVMHQS